MLELMVVLAIIALLAQFSASFVQQIHAQVATQKEADSITSLLKLARALSLAKGHRVTVCYLEDDACREEKSRALSAFVDAAPVGEFNADDLLLRQFAVVGGDIYIVPVVTRVSFRANGMTDMPTSVYVCSHASPSIGQRVVVSRPGRVRLASDDESDFQERIDRYCGS